MREADFLQTNTAYKVYIFHNESIIQTLPFTTVAVPTTNDFTPTRTGFTMRFAPGVLPFNSEIPYRENQKGLYEVYGKEGEVLLLPMYMDSIRPLKTGWAFINGLGTFISACARYSCVPNPGYGMTSESIYPSVANRYHKVFLGFQSLNNKDTGVISTKDGADGELFLIRLIADK